MVVWIATAFGALDVRHHALAEQKYELLVAPTTAQDPVLLFGDGADLWLSLLAGDVEDADLDERGLDILQDFARVGLASSDLSHPDRARDLRAPWMDSALHELVYAVLARVARSIQIDVVFIKGPTLHAQGLRQRTHSGDVDCWVRPGDETRLAEAMRAWGWTPVTSAFTGTSVAHSVTLSAVSWGCEIDIHTRYPGMTVDPEVAFNHVLSRSEARLFAGTECRTPSVGVHAVIFALHELRPVVGNAPSRSHVEAAILALRVAGPGGLRAADELGAGYALEACLKEAFPTLEVSFADAAPPPEWTWRAHESKARGLYMAVRSLPARQRPMVLRRLFFPSRAVLIASGRLTDDSSSLAGAYLRRIGDAVRSLFKRKD